VLQALGRRLFGKRRGPSKSDALAVLKRIGTPIGDVLDVGVQTCTHELIEAFPDRRHMLMEPVTEWNDDIHRHYRAGGVDYEIINVAVTSFDGEASLKLSSVQSDKKITHARISNDGDEALRRVPARTLDSLVAEHRPTPPYLLKIDVDGAELEVLSGAKRTLADASVVIIETGIADLVERASMVTSAGFQVFDIVDLSYYDDRFVQADMVFLNNKTIHEHKLSVYRDGFDIAHWQTFVP